jgi:SAM-dependent methyltransferase
VQNVHQRDAAGDGTSECMIGKILRPLFLIKAKKIYRECQKFVNGGLIDIGAGRCLIARELQKKKGVRATCVDVTNLNETSLALIVYNGKRLPFKDDSFDSALIAYVLHHCENQIGIIKEAARVCKGNIIIFEDTKVGTVTKMMDFLANRFRGIETPFLFHNEVGWRRIFKSLNLEVVSVRKDVEKEWFYPFVEHTMFVVKKRAHLLLSKEDNLNTDFDNSSLCRNKKT